MLTQEFPWLRLRSIDFFPSKRTAWEEVKRICVGTQSGSLSEALFLTTLPSRLKAKYPSLQVYTYRGGFNSTVFKGNPYIDGTKFFPKEIFGDGITRGEKHLIQIKESFFGLEESTEPRPELYLTLEETTNCKKFLHEKLLPANKDKPLCLIHAWGSHLSPTASVEFWDSLIQRWSHRYRFWQVGLENDSAVQGCEYYFLPRPSAANARKLFALMSHAEAFVGIDASPMHIANAFKIPTLTLFKDVPEELGYRHYLYPQNHFAKVDNNLDKFDDFFQKLDANRR
ncbi:MAG: glycosyltransferase family 9 protein [Bdellovibrionia bacterium]